MNRDKEWKITTLNPAVFKNSVLSQEQILAWFYACDAAWVHQGDSKMPHAELTSGLCSNGFFDCRRVLKYPNLSEILAVQLARKLKEAGVDSVDWVIGSPYSAITFSYEVARALSARHGFCEKDPKDPKKMVWKGENIPQNAKVLQIEELITTSGTFKEVRRAVTEFHNGMMDFLPVVGALVHRPPKLQPDYDGNSVVSLVEKEIWAVEPPCHLCKAGSKRLRPRGNWAELTGK